LVSVNVASVNDEPVFTVGKYTNQYDRHRTDGIVRAADPDGPDSQIRYTLSNQPLIGTASVNASTGQWSYWSNHYNNYDGTIKFTITASDNRGGTDTIDVPVHHFGGGPNVNHPYTVQQVYGRTSFLPVVLDLDGDGVELIPLDSSTVTFDTNGDGEASRIGWVSADDGLLAYDQNADSDITHDELSFVGYAEGAQTDLEGLKAFDTNNDGQLSDVDTEWDKFVVWQDSNLDGASSETEINSLDDLGITAIDLASELSLPGETDEQVTGLGEFHYEDGTSGQLADVAFDVVDDEFLDARPDDEEPHSDEADAVQSFVDDRIEPESENSELDIELDRTIDLLIADSASFNAPDSAETLHITSKGDSGLLALDEPQVTEAIAAA
jgi:hypothetical protein